MNMRDQYGEILLKRWAVKFNEIFDEDNYTGMQIDSEVESQALLASFPYDGEFEFHMLVCTVHCVRFYCLT